MRKIKLTKNKYTLVDDADFSHLNQSKWHVNAYNYAVKKNSFGRNVYLHRILLGVPKEILIDHINGNSLDNRKQNLRLCTKIQNCQNQKIRSDNTSGFKGVYKPLNRNTWCANITHSKKRIHLGVFKTKEEAAHAYNKAALKYHGEFARVNKIPLLVKEAIK
jgi:hypothetical protein